MQLVVRPSLSRATKGGMRAGRAVNTTLYTPPVEEEEWSALVAEFLSGLEKALEWASSPEKLGVEVDTGVTMRDALHSLAVHNAYHMGKIVAVRQLIGAWPPAGES